MADEKNEEKKDEKKEGFFSSLTKKKKTEEEKVEDTQNMKEEVVTAKMVDTEPKETLVKAGEEIPPPRPKSAAIKKDADAEKPLYRKSKGFHMAGRSGAAKKYFDR